MDVHHDVYAGRHNKNPGSMPVRPPDPHLELTDGVIMLRAPTADDASSVAQLVLASLEHLQPWLQWAKPTYTEQSALDYFGGRIDPTAHPMLIFNAEGQMVGGSGLNRFDVQNRVADLGYWIGVGHTGKGYAKRAATLVARHAIDTVGVERLEILTSVDNEASIRVAECLVREGIAVYEGVQKKRLQVAGVQHDTHCYIVLSRPDVGSLGNL